MIKRTVIALWISLLILTGARASEGMWLPFLINDNLYEEMQRMGLNLTREQIFSFNESSVKDAIVSFGGGCTAEIISSQGLLLTNHHCGYGRIQMHSSPENDILTDGFWAMTRGEELSNPGLSVTFLVNVKDVTSEVQSALNDQMTAAERNQAIRRVSDRLSAEAIKNTHYIANVRAMFAGNEYYLFVYERFNDVRLVGTPPSSIGKYGGDTDNWMWPRHTGDFMLFRVYTGPDGKPAEYHADNVPLKPRHHLPVSVAGVKEGDFAMVLGYPGNTDRYLTSHGIDFMVEKQLPVRIDIRRQKLDIMEAGMASSAEIRIQYASRQSGIANYWKNFIGMRNALQKHNVAAEKRQLEQNFVNWVNSDASRTREYGNVMQMFENSYNGYRQFETANFIFIEAIATGPMIAGYANRFEKLEKLLRDKAPANEIEAEVKVLSDIKAGVYRNYNKGVERNLWAAMVKAYYTLTPPQYQPAVLAEINRKYRGDFNRFADDVYSKSIFADAASISRFLEKPSLKVLEKDPAYITARAAFRKDAEIREQMAVYDEQLALARRLFIKGLREMDPQGMFYPDANSTMRFTYGSVRAYDPADAITYHYTTTLDGVIEKHNPGHHEFVLPEKLIQLHRDRDFGPYGENGKLIVNFISDNDITGGNSGSPVLDANGHLIGLAFDGNWEAMSGDILFEQRMQRCINVDIRYVLFVIDKFAGARHLVDEMTIVGRNPETK
jgi:hypothetical protein